MDEDLIEDHSFEKVSKRFSMRVSEDFSKKCNYLFDLTNFPDNKSELLDLFGS